jgi:hypothetical protein
MTTINKRRNTNMCRHKITFSGDTIRFVYDDNLRCLERLGEPVTKRASEVERSPRDNLWYADLRASGINLMLGGFVNRSEALRAERQYIEDNVL